MAYNLISKHGGYRNLKSFQTAEIIYDLTVEFCRRYIPSHKMRDQLEGAARGGKQNISEGSQTSGTSKQSELRLIDVARASLQELLEDLKDFLRQHNFVIWDKDSAKAKEVRALAYRTDRTCKTYWSYTGDSEAAANCLICLINQANFLLDRQLDTLAKELGEKGDLRERIKTFQKNELLGLNEPDFDEFLKQHGMRRLEDGRVVKDEDK